MGRSVVGRIGWVSLKGEPIECSEAVVAKVLDLKAAVVGSAVEKQQMEQVREQMRAIVAVEADWRVLQLLVVEVELREIILSLRRPRQVAAAGALVQA